MRLKVLVLTNLFPTPWDPLRSPFNRQQFERLGRRHDVDVLTAVDFREWIGGRRGKVVVEGVRTDQFVFVYPPGFGRSLHALCWFLSLLAQRALRLRAARYDCVLASWAYPDAVASRWVARWLGIPCIVKVHGSDLNVQATYALRRWQIRGALRAAGAVIAVSRALAAKAVVIGANSKLVHTLYNGVDSDVFSPGSQAQARANLHVTVVGPLLLYVGNLKRSKGCMDLLEAFPAVLAAHPAARLVYVGAGACQDELTERAAELGCVVQVRCVGAVAHVALVDWFRAADVLCLPSHNEGVPNVILEAMACGVPIVASSVGGIPEVVPDYAGILVPAQQTGPLAAALLDAITRGWDKPRIAAHASGFRWADNIDRLDAIVCAVAGGTPLRSNEIL